MPEHRGPGLRPHPRPYPREHRPPALRHVRQVKHPGRYPVTNIQILLGQVDHLQIERMGQVYDDFNQWLVALSLNSLAGSL